MGGNRGQCEAGRNDNAQVFIAPNCESTAQAGALPHLPKNQVPTLSEVRQTLRHGPPLPVPSQWEPSQLSQSAPRAPSGVLRAALETAWANPNAEGCWTVPLRTAPARSAVRHCFTPGLGQWARPEGIEAETRAFAGALHWVRGFSPLSIRVSGSGSFRVHEFGFGSP